MEVRKTRGEDEKAESIVRCLTRLTTDDQQLRCGLDAIDVCVGLQITEAIYS